MIPFEATPTGQKLFAGKNWFDRKMKKAYEKDVFGTMFELGLAFGLMLGPPLAIVLSTCF